MNKSVKKIIDHCVKHHFLAPDLSKFSYLGSHLQHKLKNEWFLNNITIGNNTLLIENVDHNKPLYSELLQNLSDCRSLFTSNVSISLANISSVKSSSMSRISIPATIDELIDLMPTTYLNLYTFSHPSQKIEDFTALQKRRKLWWKYYLQQPELLNLLSDPDPNPLLEQKIEIGSSAWGANSNNKLEVISIWKPEFYETEEITEAIRSNIVFKQQRKQILPTLITSQTRIELATLFFLIDAYTSYNKTFSLHLHPSLAPYTVGIVTDDKATKVKQLQDLQQLLTLKLHKLKISVLPHSAQWSTVQCDARALPYLIFLDDSTLENGICSLRNRDTSIKEGVHISDVVQRLSHVFNK